ncbi:hypothetical protein CCMA1212_008146 [Trichoderma ghanense]|uniref:Uncharacterized protein n=1 Tax=Trichoderma ghanense TaxID=65468 RepID=A0ABY2GXA1_9HYPO
MSSVFLLDQTGTSPTSSHSSPFAFDLALVLVPDWHKPNFKSKPSIRLLHGWLPCWTTTAFRHKITPHLVFHLQCIMDAWAVSRGWAVSGVSGHVLSQPAPSFVPRRHLDMFLSGRGSPAGARLAGSLFICFGRTCSELCDCLSAGARLAGSESLGDHLVDGRVERRCLPAGTRLAGDRPPPWSSDVGRLSRTSADRFFGPLHLGGET